MTKINDDVLAKFASARPGQPVVMLNLLKFKKDGGLERYAQYGEAVMPLLAKVGGKLRYDGMAAELVIGSETWDMIAIVEYPSRAAFMDMVTSPEYRKIVHLREEALERSVLYATDPLRPPK
jgi:uncharacterized protein (DUF1330 family)